MPWKIQKTTNCPKEKPWGVIKETDGKLEGCHTTEEQARQHQKALYANEGKKK